MQYFPTPWKHAAIVMIHKPGKDVLNPINNHPLSLLNTQAKLFETLLFTRLKVHTLPKIRSEKHGFRAKHSTSMQLIPVTDDIINNLNKREKTAAVLSGVKKLLIRSGTHGNPLSTYRHHQLFAIWPYVIRENKISLPPGRLMQGYLKAPALFHQSIKLHQWHTPSS